VQLAQVPGTFIAALLATRVIRRFDKKRAMILGVAGFGACVLLPVLLPLVRALPPAGARATPGGRSRRRFPASRSSAPRPGAR